MIVFRSTCWTASMNIRPTPFHPKMVSVIAAPPMMPPISKAISVVIGIMALRKAWRMMTVRSLRPLARAVRT